MNRWAAPPRIRSEDMRGSSRGGKGAFGGGRNTALLSGPLAQRLTVLPLLPRRMAT